MNLFFEKNKVICAKNTKESKKVIRRMDNAQKSSCLYSGVLLSFKVQIQERYGEHYDKIRMPRWHER